MTTKKNPNLFNEVSQIQMSNLPEIEELYSRPLNLDLQDKPILSSNSLVPRLSFTPTSVESQPLLMTYSLRKDNVIMAKNDSLRNYKLQGEYYNGI